MKKLLLLLFVLPFFFACTDDSSSSSDPDPKPIEKVGCSVDSECNTAAGELCENGECVYVPRCGNGIIDSDEQCDGENLNGKPGRCSSDCTLDWSMLGCGDGITTPELGEECDDGNRQDGDGCSCNCQRESLCGNGQIDDGEVCDGGEFCSSDCKGFRPGCGNNIVEPEHGEECDGGDDCNADCTFAID